MANTWGNINSVFTSWEAVLKWQKTGVIIGGGGGGGGGGPPPGGGGPPPGSTNFPIDVIPALSNFYLTLPTGPAQNATQIHGLAGYEIDPYFLDETYATKNSVRFRSPIAGSTTSSATTGTRTELREVDASGANAGWSPSTGTHTLTATIAISHAPANKPQVAFAQVHGGGSVSDLILYYQGNASGGPALRWKMGDGSGGAAIQSSMILQPYTLGTYFDLKIVATGGKFQIYINGTLKQTGTTIVNDPASYFKAGCYNLSDTSSDSGSDYGETHISALTVGHQTGSGGGGGGTHQYPHEFYAVTAAGGQALNQWKITLPIGSSGSPTEIKQPALATYEKDPYFVVVNDYVKFMSPVMGTTGVVTTANSSYARCELREMNSDGTNASWSATSGTHTLEVTCNVAHVPANKPDVICGQIHDSGADRLKLKTTKVSTGVYKISTTGADGNAGTGADLINPYTLGTDFTYKIVATGSQALVYVDTGSGYVLKQTLTSFTYTGCYFKHGAYVNSSTTSSPSDAAGEYGEVHSKMIKITHA